MKHEKPDKMTVPSLVSHLFKKQESTVRKGPLNDKWNVYSHDVVSSSVIEEVNYRFQVQNPNMFSSLTSEKFLFWLWKKENQLNYSKECLW